jgi:hypothetical protein
MYTSDIVKSARKLHYLPTERRGSRPEYVCTISRLGTSGSTDAEVDAALRSQEAHGHPAESSFSY